MYYGLKQGQINPNIENKYVLKLIYLVAQCSKITNTVLFLKGILHHFSAFCCFLLVIVRMSEGTFCRVEVQIIMLGNFFFLFFFFFGFYLFNLVFFLYLTSFFTFLSFCVYFFLYFSFNYFSITCTNITNIVFF